MSTSTRFVAAQAVLIAAVWLALLGREQAAAILAAHWPVSLTMAFGALVAGGTGEGGGAIAFPIFTKLLHVPAEQARVFSLAIQSVGMSAASLALIQRRAAVEWRMILWASLGGAAGMVLAATLLAPLVPAPLVRVGFTALQVALGIMLWRLRHRHPDGAGRPHDGRGAVVVLLVAGLFGGVLSGLMGTGISVVVFSLMVVYFRRSETVAVPTAVILVAPNSLVGFATYAHLGAFDDTVRAFWLAAVPVVALAAPVGAVICTRLGRRALVSILLVLIAAELLSTLWVVPLDTVTAAGAATLLVLFLLGYGAMEGLGRRRRPVDG
ncbi:MAG: sulfite exporter TauE/SafE family protein [Magnetospirillum sp.]|nr:sulfite exporter TauE/SafE family protein [Magnetospirillum sp.]